MVSSVTLNRSGAKTQPCLNPVSVKTGVESSSALMMAEWLVCKSLISATNLGGTPLLSRICHAMCQSTESKALVRSNIQRNRVLCLFHADSQTRCKLNSKSVQLLSA